MSITRTLNEFVSMRSSLDEIESQNGFSECPLPKINGDFTGKDIVSMDQFDREDVDLIMSEAFAIAGAEPRRTRGLLWDKVIASLFYEPSTRTFLSFEAAAKRLGASTISTQGVEYSSISKGESLEDTARTVERYSDLTILRQGKVGGAALAALATEKPIINAGDGVGEHPTQALLDYYTILREGNNEPESLTVTMLGDLKNGRTVHSLAKLLSKYGTRLNFVSPDELRMPESLIKQLGDDSEIGLQTSCLDEVLGESDVLYVTRVQKERFTNNDEYERLKNHFIITPEVMSRAKNDMILMHPLPRVGEITKEVDRDKRAVYFDQVENGMYLRMALLARVLGRTVIPASILGEPKGVRRR